MDKSQQVFAALGFLVLPGALPLFLIGMTITYLLLVEIVQRRKLRRLLCEAAPSEGIFP